MNPNQSDISNSLSELRAKHNEHWLNLSHRIFFGHAIDIGSIEQINARLETGQITHVELLKELHQVKGLDIPMKVTSIEAPSLVIDPAVIEGLSRPARQFYLQLAKKFVSRSAI